LFELVSILCISASA